MKVVKWTVAGTASALAISAIYAVASFKRVMAVR